MSFNDILILLLSLGVLPMSNGSNGYRDNQGRFKKGNPGGPGNPYAKKMAELRTAFMGAIGNQDVKKIVKAMTAKAIDGDTAAARLVLSYMIGSTFNAEELIVEIQRQEKETGENLDQIPPEVLERVLREWEFENQNRSMRLK